MEGPSERNPQPVSHRGLRSEDSARVSATHQHAAEPAGFGSLGKKISGRTTDLIAIALVLMVGLSVGGSLIDWWRTDPDETLPDFQQPAATMQWGADGSLVALQFGGEGSALSRQTVTGDRQVADKTLREICRQIIEKKSVPTGSPDEREQRFLNSIRTQRPIESKPGRWRLYRINAPVLMIVGIGGGAARSQSLSSPDGKGHHHPIRRERVICWGLAFPTTATSWTLYTFGPSGDDSLRPSAVGEIPLPPGSRRILSMRDPAAGEFYLFAGKGPPEVWMRFFDGWFTEHGGAVSPRWHEAPDRWWTRFVVSGNRERSPNGTVDINIQRNSAGKWTGVVSLLPVDRKRGRR